MFRTHGYAGRAYLVIGPILNKTFEVGGGRSVSKPRSQWPNIHARFNSIGDHAGVNLYVDWCGLMFEANLTDCRHWNWTADRFYLPGEEPKFEGYPHE